MGKFVLKTATNGQTYFRLQAGNGESILASEMYKTKAAAEKGIESVRINSIDDVRYERKLSAKGQPMFNLKAANHQVIGTSETYSSEQARDAGIESVRKNAPDAEVEDET